MESKRFAPSFWTKIKATLWVIEAIFVSYYILHGGIEAFKSAILTNAKIRAKVTETREEEREDGHQIGKVTVAAYEFTVDGQKFRGATSGQLGTWSVGDTLEVLYYRHDPSRNRRNGDREKIVNILLVSIAGLLFVYWAIKINLPVLRDSFKR